MVKFGSRGRFLTRHWLLHGPAEASFPGVLPRHRPDGPSQRPTVKSERVGPDPLGQYLVYVWALVEISSLMEKEFVVYLNEQEKLLCQEMSKFRVSKCCQIHSSVLFSLKNN